MYEFTKSQELFVRSAAVIPNWFTSIAHSETDIRRTLDVTDVAFTEVKQQCA
jgi:glutamate-1-semialdehyde aminotransferase